MRGKKNMHREIQIKQFPIVTTHWWPKTQNERFVWENEQYLYRFLPLVHNHVKVKWVRTHIRCVTCVCARSGSRLTEGVSEAWCWGNCHHSCRFWTVYSRIMMTYFKQTRLLSSLYLYTSAPCIRFIHLEPGTVYWDMTPAEEKKRNLTMTKRSMYPFHSSVTRRQRLTEGVSEAWCFKKLFELFDSIIIYGYVYSFWHKMMAL